MCILQLSCLQAEPLLQRRFAVIAQALIITYRHQKEIEDRPSVAEMIDIPLTHQTMIYPAQLFGNPADQMWMNGGFVDCHDDLLQG